ncbi:unnamed protein product [Kuraishia capsulata CBS 1993]|uniref:Manganese/iron superoxide dismutase C-terminal domain-containing protein n=1 Tax=Kuraishia capsulata CBS 1993 TaxID=1382522 RepID=W6MW97_9ASCO|nr:uncharacterized protein KUCA_T00003042001 [Kuraishia capsulata CBS 1993]CDK27065.1 unnamed protein product [Kuraishia capsulata CBS 1993]
MFSKPVLRATTRSARHIHTVPTLPLQEEWASKGIPQLLSKDGFNTAWTQYQNYLLTRLTLKTQGTEFENRSVSDIVISSAKRSQNTSIYHFASQAFNNHFFFQQFSNKSQGSVPSYGLSSLIKDQFGSIEEFRESFLFEADSLSGQGWVWLVEESDKKLSILKSYNDGTPLYLPRNQSMDLNGAVTLEQYEALETYKKMVDTKLEDFTLPLLCVNVWDYCWLHDFGINGKAEYLEKFWESIDWNVVNSRVYNLTDVE